jgi:hypothetical protein
LKLSILAISEFEINVDPFLIYGLPKKAKPGLRKN